MLETIPCDLCGSARSQVHLCVKDRIYGIPGEFALIRCQACGLLYINPRPDRASIGAFYPDLAYHAFQESTGLKSRLLAARQNSAASALLNGLPTDARTLEIGCGTGTLLVALRDQGALVTGVEPNAAAVQTASDRFGLTVHTGMLDDVIDELAPASFDLVLMKYALEHVHSPRETLAQIETLLRPGGRAVFWLPNADSWDARLFKACWRGLDAPRHLFIFTPQTISRYAETARMQVANVTYSGVPNDWAGSLEFWLKERGLPPAMARWFGLDNPLAMAAMLPFSAAAALAGRAGRMRVTMVRRGG